MDRYAHNDGNRAGVREADSHNQHVPDESDPAWQPAPAQAGDLFDGTPAAPPRVKERDELNSAQQATFDRLVANPVAFQEVSALRFEQVTKHGHSDESDAEMSFVQMLRHTRERLDDAIEFAQQVRSCADPDRRRNYLDVARRKTAIAAAMALANMDRLQIEMENEG